jgi:TRAP-type C4-dicarboxylate transport system substrate-binding protein
LGPPRSRLKYANNSPLSHRLTVRVKEATDAIRSETGGKVDIQVFPNNQLEADTDMLSQLRASGIEFFTLSPLILSALVPMASLSGLGFAWSGYDKVWPAMDGPVGAFVCAGIRKANLIAFEKMYDNGFRQNTSLRTRVADGQENPLVTIETAKLFEVQKFVAKTNRMWDGFGFLANARSYERFPNEVRAAIEKHVNAGAVRQREDTARLNSTLEKDLVAKGLTFNAVDTAAFQAKLQSAGFYKEWQGRFGDDAWQLLERSSGATL